MKRYYKKLEPLTIEYHDYSSFNGDNFRTDLKSKLDQCESLTVGKFNAFSMKH